MLQIAFFLFIQKINSTIIFITKVFITLKKGEFFSQEYGLCKKADWVGSEENWK